MKYEYVSVCLPAARRDEFSKSCLGRVKEDLRTMVMSSTAAAEKKTEEIN